MDKDQALKLMVENGLNQTQIAKMQGVTPQCVSKSLHDVITSPEFRLFQKDKADVFEAVQLRLLQVLEDDPSIFARLVDKRGMVDLGILEDKIRTIRGQSTSISDIQVRGLLAMLLHSDSKTATNVDNLERMLSTAQVTDITTS